MGVDNTGGFSYSGFKGYGNADERIDERGKRGRTIKTDFYGPFLSLFL